ncbi:hypothetical protein [Synechococcus sp. CS-603]|nr:hypothetical protein [Synechococcus sp. CS-603]
MKKHATALILALGLVGTALTPSWSSAVINALVTPAQARVGRPLTPVSVAGVGRRTVRRCAVGIYDC